VNRWALFIMTADVPLTNARRNAEGFMCDCSANALLADRLLGLDCCVLRILQRIDLQHEDPRRRRSW